MTAAGRGYRIWHGKLDSQEHPHEKDRRDYSGFSSAVRRADWMSFVSAALPRRRHAELFVELR
jgi:hypothetical protein